MARIDLHMHSTHSDGVRPPAWVVEQAARHGAELIALTDHDTLNGVAEAQSAGARWGVAVIAGVEIGVHDAELGELHVLGYLPSQAPLADLERQLQSYRDERDTRARRTVDRLCELGHPIDFATVERFAGDAPIGRPHIARALVAAGHVESVQEAFDRLLRNDGPAFVPRALLSLEDSIQLIHAVNGFTSLAHPSRYSDPAGAIRTFAAADGDGVEIYYRNDSADRVAQGEQLARELRLQPTAGSDFHGLHPEEMLPGCAPAPPHAADQIIELLKDFQ